MTWIEKIQMFLVSARVAAGLPLSSTARLGAFAGRLVLPLLVAMLFCVWTPLLAWALGAMLLPDRPQL